MHVIIKAWKRSAYTPFGCERRRNLEDPDVDGIIK
jgi:hypothetical protein